MLSAVSAPVLAPVPLTVVAIEGLGAPGVPPGGVAARPFLGHVKKATRPASAAA